MSRTKYDEFGYGLVTRNYKVKCKECESMTLLNSDYDECEHCGAYHCPDCLTLNPETRKSLAGVYCCVCGYYQNGSEV